MAVDIQLDGISVIGGGTATGRWWVDFASVRVTQDIAVQQTEADFDLWIRGTWDAATGQWQWPIAAPQGQEEVVFYNASGAREFGGILQEVTEEEREPNVLVYHCHCSDYTQWFNRHLVNATYPENTTVQSLVEQVVATYVNTPGNGRIFSTAGVQPFPQLPLPILQFVYQPPSEVLSQLTQMLGWGWYLGFDRTVYLYSTTNLPSPLPNNTLNADDLLQDPSETATLADWVDLQITQDTSQLKNVVYITGIYIANQQLYAQQFQGDGVTTVFTLGYQPPNDVANITVQVGSTYYQIAEDLVDSMPGGPCQAQTAYVNFSAQTVRFCAAPASGTTITVTYYPMTQTVVGEADAESQAYLAQISGTDGVFAYNHMDPSLSAELPTLAQERAAITLQKYAYPIITLTFRSFRPGWRVGQYFTFQSLRRYQGQYNGQSFFVIRVDKRLVQATTDWLWEYTIKASSIPFEI